MIATNTRHLRYLASTAVLLLVALCSGCATPQSVSYLLLDLPPQALPEGQQPTLSVGPVQIPDYLKRNSLAVRLSDNTLSYRGNERWAEPLDLGIQRLLSTALGQQLNTARVSAFPSLLAGEASYRLALNIAQLEPRGTEVILAAEWLLYRRGEPQPIRSASIERSQPLTDNSGASIAAGMSRLLEQLATDAAAAVRRAGS